MRSIDFEIDRIKLEEVKIRFPNNKPKKKEEIIYFYKLNFSNKKIKEEKKAQKLPEYC